MILLAVRFPAQDQIAPPTPKVHPAPYGRPDLALPDGVARHRKTLLPVLLKAIKDPDAEIRADALNALLSLGVDEEVIRALIGALVDDEEEIRRQATNALQRMGSEAVPALLETFKGKDLARRRAAAAMLGTIGAAAQDVLPALAKALEDRNESLALRKVAAGAIRSIVTPTTTAANSLLPEIVRPRSEPEPLPPSPK